MESLDSDTGSECFESAEESLDENNELEFRTIKSKKNLCKSEREVAEPVFSNYNASESAEQLEEKISNLSYRKRPERVRRSLSKPQRKSASKSPSNEIIFNADKIVPDVFFQDITSSLTKNINKSLNTLQQTSSNVKDLILNSLPVSSIDDNEGFSYDDKNISFSLTESVSNTEPNSQFNNHSEIFLNLTEKVVGDEEKDFEGKSKFSQITSTSTASCTDRSDTVVKPIRTHDMKTKNLSFEGGIIDDIVQQEINTNDKVKEGQFESTSSSSDCLNKVAGDKSQQDMKITYKESKKDLRDSYKTCSSYKNSEILDNQKKTNNEKINETDSLNMDQQNEKFDITKEICTGTIELLDKESDFFKKKCLKSATLDKLTHENSLIYSEITNNSGSFSSEDGDNYIYLSENQNKIHPDCNLEELKMALKNIFKEENNNSEIVKENFENKLLKEDCSLEEKVKVNLNSNDGWDDFEFSDDEVENINQSERDKNIKKEGENLNYEPLEKNKADFAKSKPLSENVEIKNQKSKINVLSSNSLTKNSIYEKKFPAKDIKNSDLSVKEGNSSMEEDPKKTEITIKPSKSKSVYDDSWDWDNWDEITSNKEKVKFKSSENPLDKKPKEEDFFDVSKWSGWDTFGQKSQEKQGNWNLGSWGVDVLLNKATAVTQGISNVIEAGLGAPDPETLLRLEKEEREKLKEYEKKKSEVECEEPSAENFKKNSLTNVTLFPVSGITSLVAGVTSKIVEHSIIQEIGSKVITGGLDTLETFGKKTMEVLQEGDPGLKNKRALLLGNSKPVLSQVLKEAREKVDKEMKKAEEIEITKKCHFETLFDDFQGMVHLEALEMLSRQGELKLDQIKNGMNCEELEDLNGILEEVEQLCSLEELIMETSSVVDFKTAVQMAVEPLKNEISIQRIIQILEDVHKWLKMATETKPSIILINQKLVSTLAELTAATVQQFHKSGELLCVKECRKTVEEVDALSSLTNVLCKEINRLGEKFLLLSHSISSMDNNDKNVNSFNEKVAVVVNNSMLYIRQAFNLLIPVIQLGAAV